MSERSSRNITPFYKIFLVVIIVGAVDNGYNPVFNSGKMGYFVVEKPVGVVVLNCGISRACTHALSTLLGVYTLGVDKRTHFLLVLIHQLCTVFTQVLGIQFLPDFCYLLTDHKIKLNRFFNLFNRMNSSGVVFTA